MCALKKKEFKITIFTQEEKSVFKLKQNKCSYHFWRYRCEINPQIVELFL